MDRDSMSMRNISPSRLIMMTMTMTMIVIMMLIDTFSSIQLQLACPCPSPPSLLSVFSPLYVATVAVYFICFLYYICSAFPCSLPCPFLETQRTSDGKCLVSVFLAQLLLLLELVVPIPSLSLSHSIPTLPLPPLTVSYLLTSPTPPHPLPHSPISLFACCF
jgi:hypothetical protein